MKMKYLKQFLRHPKVKELAKICRGITDIDLNFAAAEEARRLFNPEAALAVICVGDGKESITGRIFTILFPQWSIWSVDPHALKHSHAKHIILRKKISEEIVRSIARSSRRTLIVAVHSHAPLPHNGDAAIAIPCCVKQTRFGKCMTKRSKAIHGTKHKTIKIWPPFMSGISNERN